jgi:RNA polymerase sigma-70 factor (ECF subfamily)
VAANGEAALAELASPAETNGPDEVEYRQQLVGRALKLMQTEFQPATWKACWECVVMDRPAADVARELGITLNAVYLAKSRVLRRLHQELDGLIE